MKNNVRLCCLPATEVSQKQQNFCGLGIAALTKRLFVLFSFNRQNVYHDGLSWPFAASVTSKCMLSRALLLHTIERSLGVRGVAAVSQDYSSDSFAAEVEQTKININILQPSNTFDFNGKAEYDAADRSIRLR